MSGGVTDRAGRRDGRDRGDLEIRRATAADGEAVVDLLARSLGWLPDELHTAFFGWKHLDNPFGASPAWVAVDEGRVVGFRAFLRWAFQLDGETLTAVRAVDTATHPDHRGRGIFTRLTLQALEELRAEGVSFVFNTPNELSRPGYLKMGWEVAGRIAIAVRPGRVAGLRRTAEARTAADQWSVATSAGIPAAEVFSDGPHAALVAPPAEGVLTTLRTAPYFAWRYGFPPLHYRGIALGDDPAEGVAVFRLRRRGPALEAVIDEILAPGGDRRVHRTLLREVLRRTGADHAVMALAGAAPGAIPIPRQGPVLTVRAVNDRPPALRRWRLSLGDVELL